MEFYGTERQRPALPRREIEHKLGSTPQQDEAIMAEKAGEPVRDSGDYRCERCHKVTPMSKGALIPPCPHCGYDTFDIANPRFEKRDGSLGPHEPG
jgi:hypothetical protein